MRENIILAIIIITSLVTVFMPTTHNVAPTVEADVVKISPEVLQQIQAACKQQKFE